MAKDETDGSSSVVVDSVVSSVGSELMGMLNDVDHENMKNVGRMGKANEKICWEENNKYIKRMGEHDVFVFFLYSQ